MADTVQRDLSCISRWRAGAKVPTGTSQTLRLVLQVFTMREVVESEDTVRAQFLGMNPDLNFAAPAEAVRIDQHRDVMTAARVRSSTPPEPTSAKAVDAIRFIMNTTIHNEPFR